MTVLAGLLDRRARYVTEGAEDAAVACIRAQERAAASALVEELAGVGRHRFRRLMAAMRACEGGLKLHPPLPHGLEHRGLKVGFPHKGQGNQHRADPE